MRREDSDGSKKEAHYLSTGPNHDCDRLRRPLASALAQRWILQYNFYINDQRWGRMFVRMCPYLPFSVRVCLSQHHWLAKRLLSKGVDFEQCSNAFLKCSDPGKLQELATP
jgi:hypothetical protein